MRSHLALALWLLSARASAEPSTFALASGESRVQFVSDAPLERITGSTTRVSGKLMLDPSHPEQARGQIVVPVASIKTNNDLRDEHLRSDSWLDAARFPDVQFTLASVSGLGALALDQAARADVRGTLSVHGVARELSTSAKVRLTEQGGKSTLRVQASFPVSLEAHEVSVPSLVRLKVAATIQVNVDLYAHAAAPERRLEPRAESPAASEAPAKLPAAEPDTQARVAGARARAKPAPRVRGAGSTASAPSGVQEAGATASQPEQDASAHVQAEHMEEAVPDAAASEPPAGRVAAAASAAPSPQPPASAERGAACGAAPRARQSWPAGAVCLSAVLLAGRWRARRDRRRA